MRGLLLVSMLAILTSANARALDFAIVYIDEPTEDRLGEFPIKRSYYAQIIDVLNSHYDAQTVVLKIFVDLPRPEDKELLAALKKHKNVYSQILGVTEEAPCQSDSSLLPLGSRAKSWENHNCIWVPNHEMVVAFKGLGFVNGRSDKQNKSDAFMMVTAVNDKAYASLPLRLASDHLKLPIVLEGQKVLLGGKEIKLEADGAYGLDSMPMSSKYPSYSFIEVLDKKVSRDELENKIVFLFYQGKNYQSLKFKKGQKATQADVVTWVTDELIRSHSK